jgi:hypothetical protein
VFANRRQQSLLPRLAPRFVAPAAALKLAPWLNQPAFLAAAGVVPFSAAVLARHLPDQLPSHWRGAKAVAWDPLLPGSDHHTRGSSIVGDRPPPSALWLASLWQEVDLAAPETATLLRDWPLLPVHAAPQLEPQSTTLAAAVPTSSASSGSAAAAAEPEPGPALSSVEAERVRTLLKQHSVVGPEPEAAEGVSSAAAEDFQELTALMARANPLSAAEATRVRWLMARHSPQPGRASPPAGSGDADGGAAQAGSLAVTLLAEGSTPPTLPPALPPERCALLVSCSLADLVVRAPGAINPILRASLRAAGARATAAAAADARADAAAAARDAAAEATRRDALGWARQVEALPPLPPAARSPNPPGRHAAAGPAGGVAAALPPLPPRFVGLHSQNGRGLDGEQPLPGDLGADSSDDDDVDLDAPLRANESAAAGASGGARATLGTVAGTGAGTAAAANANAAADGDAGVAPAVLAVLLAVGLPVLELAFFPPRTLAAPGFLAHLPEDLSRTALHALATFTQRDRDRADQSGATGNGNGSGDNGGGGTRGFLSALGRDIGRAARAAHGGSSSSRSSSSDAAFAEGWSDDAGSRLLQLAWPRLGAAALDALLELFARPNGRQAAVLTPSLADKLQRLPLFETLAGGPRVALLPAPRVPPRAPPASLGSAAGSAGGGARNGSGYGGAPFAGEPLEQAYYYTLEDDHGSGSSNSGSGGSGGGTSRSGAAFAPAAAAGAGGVPLPLAARARFLVAREDWVRDVHRDLGVPSLDAAGVLTRFLLPGFGGLAKSDQDALLAFVGAQWATLKQADPAFVVAMANVPFLPRAAAVAGQDGAANGSSSGGGGGGSNGGLLWARARELLDPSHPLLAHVFDDCPEAFPPLGPPFHFGRAAGPWLPILRELGLPARVDRDSLLRCAQHVEAKYLQEVRDRLHVARIQSAHFGKN